MRGGGGGCTSCFSSKISTALLECTDLTKGRIGNKLHLVVKMQMFMNKNTKVIGVLNQFNVLTFARENTATEIIICVGRTDHHGLCLGRVQLQPNFIEVNT